MKRIVLIVALALVSTGAWGQSSISTEGMIESTTGGFKFPDGSVQATAAMDSFVVLDSDSPPKAVGRVVSITSVTKALVKLAVGDKEVIFEVGKGGIRYTSSTYYYDSDDCTGQTYFDYSGDGSSDAWFDNVVIAPIYEYQDGIYRTIIGSQTYVISGPYFLEDDDLKTLYKMTSMWTEPAGPEYWECAEAIGWFLARPVESLNTNLLELYPPPFTMVEQ